MSLSWILLNVIDILASSLKKINVNGGVKIEGRSLIYIRNNNGPITEPLGTLELAGQYSE